MSGPLAAFGQDWADMAEGATDLQVDLLRRMASELDHDTHAMRAIEGARDWRDLTAKRGVAR